MVNTIVNLEFNNNQFYGSGGNVAGSYSGNVTIDYTTRTIIDGAVTVNYLGGPTYTYSGANLYFVDFTNTPAPAGASPAPFQYGMLASSSVSYIDNPDGSVTASFPNGAINIHYSGQSPTAIGAIVISPGTTITSNPNNPGAPFVQSGRIYTTAPSGSFSDSPSITEPVIATTISGTPTVVCFAAGTLIRTVRGDVPVETLTPGDIVITASGSERPIIWIGRREFDCSTHPNQTAVWPIRVMAGAFSENRPSRDLFLSPQHSVLVNCIDEVLIPIKYLVNGGTIAQIPRDRISYWHVELDTHDLLLAEGLAVESFLDTQGRIGVFDNGAEHAEAHPDLPPKTMEDFCRPIVLDGPVIDAARARLIIRMQALGWTASYESDLHVVADGVRINGDVASSTVRFVLPAATKDLRIRSKSFVPKEFEVASGDGRRLGVPLKSVTIADGLEIAREVALNELSLSRGFNEIQSDAELVWRWTDGDAALPADLWAGSRGTFFLRLELAAERGNFRSWAEPVATLGMTSEELPVIDLDAHRRKLVS